MFLAYLQGIETTVYKQEKEEILKFLAYLQGIETEVILAWEK